MQTVTALGREQFRWPSIGWSFTPDRLSGVIPKRLDVDSRLAITKASPGLVQFGVSLWFIHKVIDEKVKSEKGRTVKRMKVFGSEIMCRGEIRDGGGVIRVWFDAQGKTWEASKMNGWIPKPYESNQTLASPYRADLDARKCIGMASMHLPAA